MADLNENPMVIIINNLISISACWLRPAWWRRSCTAPAWPGDKPKDPIHAGQIQAEMLQKVSGTTLGCAATLILAEPGDLGIEPESEDCGVTHEGERPRKADEGMTPSG